MGYDNFDMRVGDGFENIFDDDNIEEVIISGLGGLEILKILQKSTICVSSMIIQPQNNNILLKKYLVENGYNIVFDKIIHDDKFYNIFKVVKGAWLGNEFDLYFGKDNFAKNDDFIKYLNYIDEKIIRFIDKLTGEKLDEYKKIMAYLKIAKSKLGV